jgi:hypothetical protein
MYTQSKLVNLKVAEQLADADVWGIIIVKRIVKTWWCEGVGWILLT